LKLAIFENKKCPHRDLDLKVMEILKSSAEKPDQCDKKEKIERIDIG